MTLTAIVECPTFVDIVTSLFAAASVWHNRLACCRGTLRSKYSRMLFFSTKKSASNRNQTYIAYVLNNRWSCFVENELFNLLFKCERKSPKNVQIKRMSFFKQFLISLHNVLKFNKDKRILRACFVGKFGGNRSLQSPTRFDFDGRGVFNEISPMPPVRVRQLCCIDFGWSTPLGSSSYWGPQTGHKMAHPRARARTRL